MGKTNELRKLVKSALVEFCSNTYFELADEEELYPHIVFNFDNVDLGDLSRDDNIIEIHLWDKGNSAQAIEDMEDQIEEKFRNWNAPQDTILPTFFVIDRRRVEDEDKKIKHRVIRVQVQNYER